MRQLLLACLTTAWLILTGSIPIAQETTPPCGTEPPQCSSFWARFTTKICQEYRDSKARCEATLARDADMKGRFDKANSFTIPQPIEKYCRNKTVGDDC